LVVGDDDVKERTLGVNKRGSNDPNAASTSAPFARDSLTKSRATVRPKVLDALERFSAAWREEYVTSVSASEHAKDEGECVFCTFANEEVGESSGVLLRNDTSFVILNAFPTARVTCWCFLVVTSPRFRN